MRISSKILNVTKQMVKRARGQTNLTQGQAAELVKVSRERWNKWERGRAVMPRYDYELFCWMLKIDPEAGTRYRFTMNKNGRGFRCEDRLEKTRNTG